ncbi:hypothetical protein K443DRAFT_682295 [Laccaria amethystina LaAM-08-1]|jgi:hypothetical protein|uniref:Uncharacterized protein n=1 Tax=Laccaria amethystina LaAM-08-1 TaxID=1095629 RepID=A0A0C9WKP4_9AGAR|nr:hypothetical protein K443DRAFT_682295 [Laccaria amethystina LaAM-08-1]
MASPDALAIHEEPTTEVVIIDLTGDTESEPEDDEDEDEEEDDGEEESADELNSDGSEVVIHLNEETRTQLRNAISTVSESRLREMLKTFVGTELAVEAALTKELITVRRDTHAVVPRWETCATCGVEYDINLPRGNDECTFHPGVLAVDAKTSDEGPQGPSDGVENLKWTCCGKDGGSVGCVRGEHKPSEPSKKRKREEA